MEISESKMKDIYTFTKEMIEKLDVCGWDAQFTGIQFTGADNLLDFFIKNMKRIKEGCDLIVAKAIGEGDYNINHDELYFSSEKIKAGSLITITHYGYRDNGCHDFSGNRKEHNFEDDYFFILKN